MFNIAHLVIFYGIGFLILALFVRVILSWFGINERFSIIRFLARISDPFLEPPRRIIRPVGVFDMSFLIVTFFLLTVQRLLLQALPPGW